MGRRCRAWRRGNLRQSAGGDAGYTGTSHLNSVTWSDARIKVPLEEERRELCFKMASPESQCHLRTCAAFRGRSRLPWQSTCNTEGAKGI